MELKNQGTGMRMADCCGKEVRHLDFALLNPSTYPFYGSMKLMRRERFFHSIVDSLKSRIFHAGSCKLAR